MTFKNEIYLGWENEMVPTFPLEHLNYFMWNGENEKKKKR